MELSPRVKELAKKLLAMVNGGATTGEKQSAELALKRHLDRYGLTIEDVDGSELIEIEIPILDPDPADETKFSLQIVAHVIGIRRAESMAMFKDTDTGEVFYKPQVTAAEAVEIKAKIDFYWKDFQIELKALRLAYFTKNKMVIEPENSDDLPPMSPEYAAKIRRMMGVVDRKPFHKRLN